MLLPKNSGTNYDFIFFNFSWQNFWNKLIKCTLLLETHFPKITSSAEMETPLVCRMTLTSPLCDVKFNAYLSKHLFLLTVGSLHQ